MKHTYISIAGHVLEECLCSLSLYAQLKMTNVFTKSLKLLQLLGSMEKEFQKSATLTSLYCLQHKIVVIRITYGSQLDLV